MVDVVVFCFFFFQAEDGIRDWSVTGVQTCALPIYEAGPVVVVPQQRARHNVECQIGQIVFQHKVFLTVDWQTRNHREGSRLAGKVHDVEGVAQFRRIIHEHEIDGHQAIELSMASDVELVVLELSGCCFPNIEGQASIRSLGVVAKDGKWRKSFGIIKGHRGVGKHRPSDRASITAPTVNGGACENGHTPSLDLEIATYLCLARDLGIVSHNNVEGAVLIDGHRPRVEEAGQRRSSGVWASGHIQNVDVITSVVTQTHCALVHHAGNIEDIFEDTELQDSSWSVEQSAPNVCG